MKREPTVLERAWMALVQSLGCVVCRNLGWGATPAQIHHIREGQGGGQRAPHMLVLPLCESHHVGDLGIHKNRHLFEKQHGSELDLLAQVIGEVFNKMRERWSHWRQVPGHAGTTPSSE
jgi:Recombination enhancement, RecA-dependent nuclease